MKKPLKWELILLLTLLLTKLRILKNIFKEEVTKEVINRINSLHPNQKSILRKMYVAQMLVHFINIQYQAMYENEKFKKQNFIMRFIIKPIVPIINL